jgi:ribosomal protein S8
MGYSIPPGDYSLPPLQVNVGAELGKSFAAGLAAIGARKQKERDDAKKLKATQNAFKNTLVLNATKLKTDFIKSAADQGYVDDVNAGGQLIDQWKEQIKIKSLAAIDARMKMEFDQDLSDEDRNTYAQTVTDFESYSTGSLQQLGAFTADANDSTNEGFVVSGNAANGEQTVNMLTLSNIQGNPASMYGPDAIATRSLRVENNQNIVTSTVKIPVGSEYLETVNKQGGGIAAAQLEKWSQPGGKVKKEKIGDKDYYVFQSDINLSTYSKPGGVDLVNKAIEVPGSDSVFEKAGLMEDGSFNARYNDDTTIVTQEVEKDSITGKPTGYTQKVSYNIVNVGAMAQSPAYLAEINAQYEAVFLDPKTNTALKNEYLLDLAKNQPGVKALDWNDLSKMDPDEAREAVTNAMAMHQWTGYFPKQFGEKTSLAQVELKEGTALLEQAGKFKNPTSPDNYKAGDMVYVTRHVKETFKDPDAKEGDINNPTYVRLRILNNKINNAASDGDVLKLFNTVQKTPGGESFLKKIGEKVVEVKQDSTTKEWIEVADALEYDVDDLKTIYQGYK